jgi:hypothetical protein
MSTVLRKAQALHANEVVAFDGRTKIARHER